MSYDLIWKSIDKEITFEEKSILDEIVEKRPQVKLEVQKAETIDAALSLHFSHKMDLSFLTKLKKSIIEELELPTLKINFIPIIIFLAIAIITVGLFSIGNWQLNVESTHLGKDLNPFFNLVVIMSFGAMLLYGFDTFLRSRLNKRH